ncbi:MAG: hypothetical protein ABR583_09365 [Gaiellaceae bacterium]
MPDRQTQSALDEQLKEIGAQLACVSPRESGLRFAETMTTLAGSDSQTRRAALWLQPAKPAFAHRRRYDQPVADQQTQVSVEEQLKEIGAQLAWVRDYL